MNALQQADLTARKIAIKVLPAGAKRTMLRRRRQLVNTFLQCRSLAGHCGTLPSFLIIGGQKCGTTDLYDRLVKHPQVHKAILKEIDYFQVHYSMGLAWYRSHFPNLEDEKPRLEEDALLNKGYDWYRPPAAAKHGSNGRPITGEASGYLSYPAAPYRIQALLPDVKLIALLRNPVNRAYSHFNHVRRLGIEPVETFEEALELELRRKRGDAPPDPPGKRYRLGERSYLSKGLYADQLEHWYRCFPREQVMVIQSEQFYRDTRATVLAVTEFLGLPEWEPEDYRGHKQFPYEPMKPETRRWLEDYYREANARLFELLGTDFGWPT